MVQELMDLIYLFIFEHQLQDAVRSFTRREIAPIAQKVDQENEFPSVRLHILSIPEKHVLWSAPLKISTTRGHVFPEHRSTCGQNLARWV
jgi:hypothetical protein